MEAAQQVTLLVSSGQSIKDAIQSVKASKPACDSYMNAVVQGLGFREPS